MMSLMPLLAEAQQQPSEVPFVHVKKGQKVPFDGRLFTYEAVAKLLANHKQELKKALLEVEYAKQKYEIIASSNRAVCDAKLEAAAKKVKICEDARTAEKEIYMKAVERNAKQCDTKWYNSPHLWTAVGAGVCGMVVGITR
jgi:hypothetical protein